MLSQPVLSPQAKARLECTKALRAGRCRCGEPKQTGMAFCMRCWQRLPQSVRRALYKKIGQGFEDAYQAACEYLEAVSITPKKGEKA